MREELVTILRKQIQEQELLPEEKAILAQWIAAAPENNILYIQIKDSSFIKQNLQQYTSYGKNQAINEEKLLQLIQGNNTQTYKDASNTPVHNILPNKTQEHVAENSNKPYIKSKSALFKRFIGYAAAAILVFAGVYYLSQKTTDNKNIHTTLAAAEKTTTTPHLTILTLADGRKIVLDSSNNGLLAQQGNTNIEFQDGQIRYNMQAANLKTADNRPSNITDATSWNELKTPRGKMFHLVLPDGTKVWLNAASTLRFPVNFTNTQREVELTGEAYFEVANSVRANKQKNTTTRVPFKVTTKHIQVDVLGTHFNINTYEEEPNVKTTLINGAVKVTPLNNPALNPVILKPGQQANLQLADTEQHLQTTTVNTHNELAWKNGFFHLDNTNLKEVMRQIQRWYDVDVVFNNDVTNGFFSGDFPRSFTLTEALQALEISGVKSRLHNNIIYIESIQ